MSALYGSMAGERGEVTKCGNKFLSAHVRGWNVGVRIEARHGEDGDSFMVYRTGGSNGAPRDELIAEVKPIRQMQPGEQETE